MLLCLFAIFVLVQCAPQDYSEEEIFVLKDIGEEMKKGLWWLEDKTRPVFRNGGPDWKEIGRMTLNDLSRFGHIRSVRSVKSSDVKVHISYAIGSKISEDFVALVDGILLPYLREKTCLEFHKTPIRIIHHVDGRLQLIFSETSDTLGNCFAIHDGITDDYGRSLGLPITLNKECVRQKVKDRRNGITDSRVDLSKFLNDEFCISSKIQE